SVLIEEGPDSDLSPLAEAVERDLLPPYRARASRVRGELWAVQANRIDVVQIPNGPAGDAIELTPDSLVVDGEPVFGSIRELEGRGDVVRAERLDDDLWEVSASPL